jgi:hypothetical protein
MADPRDFSRPAIRRAWLRSLLGPLDDTRFDALAHELFAWQYARVTPYRRLCDAQGVTPARWTSWRDLPALPQQVFKRARLFAHGDVTPGAVYETSGTTTGEPGRQFLLQPDIYRGVAIAGARQAGFLGETGTLHFLAPAPKEAPHSSLSAMFGFWRAAAKSSQRGEFWVRDGKFHFDELRDILRTAREPVILCGTAFAFVHLLDAWRNEPPLRLPRGSRVLETGGFKGRSREVPKAELYSQLSRALGVPDIAIWNEYGMSELDGVHRTPPWARVLVVDPARGREVAPGGVGLVRWIDLANVDSVLALQTLDRAERTRDGFRLLGRLARTEPRGCSLGADDLAARTAIAA